MATRTTKASAPEPEGAEVASDTSEVPEDPNERHCPNCGNSSEWLQRTSDDAYVCLSCGHQAEVEVPEAEAE